MSSTTYDTGDTAVNKPDKSPSPPGVYNLAREAREKKSEIYGVEGCDSLPIEHEGRQGNKERLVRAGVFGADT